MAHSLQTPALESSLECVKKKSFLNIGPKKPIHKQLSVSLEASQYFHQVQGLGLITIGVGVGVGLRAGGREGKQDELKTISRNLLELPSCFQHY